MNFLKKIWSRLLDKLVANKIAEVAQHAALHRHQVFGAADRLKLHPTVIVNNALFNTVSGNITVEEGVFFGHSVSVFTGSHDADATGEQRRQWPTSGNDIIIRRGAWIASNATILGPCVIGEDAVVAACALVTTDVPPRSIVGGVPAKVIREIRGKK
jgi:acetyltransferase-like isoleucine patch superfamily enzyme